MSSLLVSICGGSFYSSDNACDLRVIVDSVLSFEAHINHVIKISYYHLLESSQTETYALSGPLVVSLILFPFF